MATHRNKDQKPTVPAPEFSSIPEYVRKRDQWVLWRYDWREDNQQWAKVPYCAWNLKHAKSDDPQTWTSFAVAEDTFRHNAKDFAGIGFVFSKNDDLCGIDFDNCVEHSEDEYLLSGSASKWVDTLNSYTELSPSGTGLHIICRAQLVAGRKDTKTGIEVYDQGRYFTFTGRSWQERPLPVAQSQEAVGKLLKAVFPAREEKPKNTPTPVVPTKSIDDLLSIAFKASNGDKIKRLFEGDLSDYAGGWSEADLGLCSMLAFYSGGDTNTLDQMFRASKLMRVKWDKKHYSDGRTYGQEVISKALANCTEFFGQKTEEQKLVPATVEDGIRSVDDYQDDLNELYEHGFVPGVSTGWDAVDDYYTVKPGQWTAVTGSPGAGKSVWLNALNVNLARLHDWRFAVFSPEFWPVATHIAELMALYVGQPFVPGPTPRMDRRTANQAAEWVRDHFTFIDLKNHALTIDYVLEATAKIHAQRPINGVIIDPWTELEQDRVIGETETDFTKRRLTEFGRFIRTEMLHGWIVAHPQKLRRDKNGDFPIPTLYDISGSAQWFNKTHMGLSLHRPDVTSNKVQIHVQKVKFRWCGQLGYAELFYDKVTGRYSEFRSTYGNGQWKGSDESEESTEW